MDCLLLCCWMNCYKVLCEIMHFVIVSSLMFYIAINNLNLNMWPGDAIRRHRTGSTSAAPRQYFTLQWRHNDHDNVSNHQPHHCLLNRLFGHRSKKTSKLRVTGLCVGNSPGTGEFPAQMASNAENASIWWRHHVTMLTGQREQFHKKHISHQLNH